MLTAISIENFKRFASQSIDLRPLSLLTGFNAGGKSTFLHGTLMLSEAMRNGGRARNIPLNSSRFQLGSIGEVIHQPRSLADAKTGPVRLAFSNTSGVSIEWRLAPSDLGSSYVLTVVGVSVREAGRDRHFDGPDWTDLEELIPSEVRSRSSIELAQAIKEICFISALRSPSGDLFPLPASGVPAYFDVGALGEFAPFYLAKYSEEEVEIRRRHPEEPGSTFRRQLNAWGGELFSYFQSNSSAIEKTGLYQLGLQTSFTEEFRSPSNVGYGIGYAFPILIAGLLAKPGQTLFVDSPEAHLHPRAQSRMGRFLGAMAASGMQIIVETHSDHVLNGIRLAVKEGVLPNDDVVVHFFGEASEKATVERAEIDSEGQLSSWPNGFFDQIESDLSRL